jgi:hypothetical protein
MHAGGPSRFKVVAMKDFSKNKMMLRDQASSSITTTEREEINSQYERVLCPLVHGLYEENMQLVI